MNNTANKPRRSNPRGSSMNRSKPVPVIRLGQGNYVKDYTPCIGSRSSPLRPWARRAWRRVCALIYGSHQPKQQHKDKCDE